MTPRNLVDLIDRHDPATLAELRRKFPNDNDLLRWDKPLGEGDLREGATAVQPRTELADKGIKTLRVRSDAILAELSLRLRRARRLKMAGAILAATTNAGLIASLAKATAISAPHLQLALAVLAFAGSLLAVFAEQAVGGPAGAQVGGLFDSSVDLSTRLLDADLRRQRLLASDAPLPRWEELLGTLDDIALLVHGVEMKARIL